MVRPNHRSRREDFDVGQLREDGADRERPLRYRHEFACGELAAIGELAPRDVEHPAGDEPWTRGTCRLSRVDRKALREMPTTRFGRPSATVAIVMPS